MIFSKDCKVKSVTQEHSIQQSHHSDVKEKYCPRQIITILNVNGLNSPIQRHTVAGWIKKKKQLYVIYRTLFIFEDTEWLKGKDG